MKPKMAGHNVEWSVFQNILYSNQMLTIAIMGCREKTWVTIPNDLQGLSRTSLTAAFGARDCDRLLGEIDHRGEMTDMLVLGHCKSGL